MRLLLVLFLSQISFISYAKEMTQELKMLPKLCQVRLTHQLNSIEFSTWKNRLGKDALHVHHYCYGLKNLIKYNANPNASFTKGVLRSARSNFDYVLTRTQNPSYILLPDIYYRLAIVAKEEGNSSEAISFANKSIQAKKNYLNPYILLSDIHLKSGNKSEAKKILLEAKKYHPNSKKLNKRLKKI